MGVISVPVQLSTSEWTHLN